MVKRLLSSGRTIGALGYFFGVKGTGIGFVVPFLETRICMSYPDRGMGTQLCLVIGFAAELCPPIYRKSAGLTKAGDIAPSFQERVNPRISEGTV